MSEARVLLVDDDEAVREALSFSLTESGFDVETAGSGEEALALFGRRRPDVVLTDLRMPGMSGIDVVKALKGIDGTVPVVVITAYASVDGAVQAMREGAEDFVGKPISREALLHTLRRVLRHRALEEENASLRRKLEEGADDKGILAVSEAMKRTLALTDRVADTDATVLIQGESGTGKELIARRLHQKSARAARPFIALNCSALPRELLEAELFGYEKGAFTGAAKPRRGRFVEASGGTLFLDEIGEMPRELQAKLLRVLQERVVDVVGGGPVDVDVRIIAATHRDLSAMVQDGSFREDLYFRLHVVPIEVPPLRDRPSDIAPLFVRFLHKAAQQTHRPAPTPSPGLLDALGQRPWPGNVREVENLATRLAVTATRDVLDIGDLPAPASPGPRGGAAVVDDGVLRLPPEGVSLEALERAAVVAALSATSGNQSKAARFLRIPRHVLLYRIDKYGIAKSDWVGSVPSPTAPLKASPEEAS